MYDVAKGVIIITEQNINEEKYVKHVKYQKFILESKKKKRKIISTYRYMRRCHRCNIIFRTMYKNGAICDNCIKIPKRSKKYDLCLSKKIDLIIKKLK